MEQKPKRTRKEGQRSKASLAALKKYWAFEPSTARHPTVLPPQTSEPALASFFSAFAEPEVRASKVRTVVGSKVIKPMSAGRHALEGLWHLIMAARLTGLALWDAVKKGSV
jgi:hypothetical protein